MVDRSTRNAPSVTPPRGCHGRYFARLISRLYWRSVTESMRLRAFLKHPEDISLSSRGCPYIHEAQKLSGYCRIMEQVYERITLQTLGTRCATTRMSKHGSKEIEVDHSACILDQQLQLLNACIHRRLRQSERAMRTKRNLIQKTSSNATY